MWEPKADVQLLFSLFTEEGSLQSLEHLTSQLAESISCPCLLSAGVTGGPPGFYVDSGDPSSGPQIFPRRSFILCASSPAQSLSFLFINVILLENSHE